MEPNDEELLGLMPQQLRDDLATVARMAAHGAGPDVTPELFEAGLTAGALQFVRAALARWGHQPAPPAEGEVAELVEGLKLISDGMDALGHEFDSWFVARTADLLEQRHPAPVPVSERLPEPEDCDAEERCWLLAPRWILPPSELTHWLPATALPLPAAEVQP